MSFKKYKIHYFLIIKGKIIQKSYSSYHQWFDIDDKIPKRWDLFYQSDKINKNDIVSDKIYTIISSIERCYNKQELRLKKLENILNL